MRSSLGLRLFLVATMSTVIALSATALVLNVLFRDYFEARVRDELETHLLQLTGNIGLDSNAEIDIAPHSDSRFSQALSGYYWQIEIEGAEPILSPSFWAAPLRLSRPETPGSILYQNVTMDTGEIVTIASWIVTLGETGAVQDVFLTVALDRADVDHAISGFTTNSTAWLAVLGAFLIVASWLTTRIGLRPLERVRADVNRVSLSRDARLHSDYPLEVRPLVNEVNALLNQNQATIEKVRTSAGNLAHGLKTPLTIMRGISHDLEKSGKAELALEMNIQIENMQHFVERELARSRDSRQTRTLSAVAPNVDRIATALRRQPGSEHLQWDIEVPETLTAPFDPFDLTELLGNLLDNAVKWARKNVVVRGGKRSDGSSYLCISDDGPGVPENQKDVIFARGERLDPSLPGSGLGLAIVQDLADTHGCSIELKTSAGSGLSVCVTWGA